MRNKPETIKADKITIAVIGRSGSGKGTQARLLLNRLGKAAHRIETGSLLRALMEKDTPTIRRARGIMKKGGLYPSWFAVYVWLKVLIEEDTAGKHLVFDGSPRTVFEAKMLDTVMAWHGRNLPLCLYIDVPSKEAEERLLRRGRADDTPEVIRARLAYFPKFVLPVVRYYRAKQRLITIDGTLSPEDAAANINKTLSRRLGNLWRQP